MKIVLYLMTQKGLSSLEQLIEQQLQKHIRYVVIGKDKRQQDYAEAIRTCCEKHDIDWHWRRQAPKPKPQDYLLAISWRWLIHSDQPLIVLHDSLLPKYRGFAPLVNMLIDGCTSIGVTALWASEKYDRGAILQQAKTPIEYPIKIKTAIQKVANLYGTVMVELIQTLATGNSPKGTTQQEQEATYSLWRDEEDYHINWQQSASAIQRFVDATGYPYAGASAWIKEQKIRILDVTLIDDVLIENRAAHIGKVIFMDDQKPTVVCGQGLLRIEKAVYDHNQASIFPLNSFRIRFK